MRETITTTIESDRSGSGSAELWDDLRLPMIMLRVAGSALPVLVGFCLGRSWPMTVILAVVTVVAWAAARELRDRFEPVAMAASFAVLSRTELYRLYDVAGRLLYVGVGWSALMRCRRHALRHGWWPEVASVRVQAYPFRGLALAVEQYVIENDEPKYNTARGALMDHAWSHGWAHPEPVEVGLHEIERALR